jgi:DNA-binding NtrC family response regulator
MVDRVPRLVVVDDDEDVLDMLVLHLNQYTVEVVPFIDPEQALQYITTNSSSIDGILSDLNLHPITGIDLLKRTRSVEPALPFYIMSGNISHEESEAARSLHVTGLLDKITMLNQFGTLIESMRSKIPFQQTGNSFSTR